MTTTPSQPNREEIRKRFEERFVFVDISQPGTLPNSLVAPILNWALSEVTQALAEQRAEIVKEIEEMESYSLGDDSLNSGYFQCKKDIIASITEGEA